MFQLEGLHKEELDLQSVQKISYKKSSYDKQGGVGDKAGLRQCRAPETEAEIVNFSPAKI